MIKIKTKISDGAARLKKIRLYFGVTRKEFGEKLKISQYTIRSWEVGAKNFSEESVKRVIKSLEKNLNFFCPFDWIMYGTGESPISLYEKKFEHDNHVQFDCLHEKLIKEITIFKQLNKDASVTIVTNDNFMPIAEIGDYVGLLPISLDKIDTYINKLVYLLSDNKTNNNKFGILQKRKQEYFINCFNDKNTSNLSLKSIKEIYLFVWFRKLFE